MSFSYVDCYDYRLHHLIRAPVRLPPTYWICTVIVGHTVDLEDLRSEYYAVCACAAPLALSTQSSPHYASPAYVRTYVWYVLAAAATSHRGAQRHVLLQATRDQPGRSELQVSMLCV